VELVDTLSTDEGFESIRADMPDHGRRPSRAHLFPRIPMNTRRSACGFRGQARPSMTISAELQKLLRTWLKKTKSGAHTYGAPCFLYAAMRMLKVVEAIWSVDREPLSFCTRCCTCKKYMRWLETSIGSPWLICTRCCTCKKYKMVRDINQEPLTNFYTLVR
jgi:hypothetical protein